MCGPIHVPFWIVPRSHTRRPLHSTQPCLCAALATQRHTDNARTHKSTYTDPQSPARRIKVHAVRLRSDSAVDIEPASTLKLSSSTQQKVFVDRLARDIVHEQQLLRRASRSCRGESSQKCVPAEQCRGGGQPPAPAQAGRPPNDKQRGVSSGAGSKIRGDPESHRQALQNVPSRPGPAPRRSRTVSQRQSANGERS